MQNTNRKLEQTDNELKSGWFVLALCGRNPT